MRANTERIHMLKCWPEEFEAIRDGSKRFEYRLNDRDFQVGDVLALEKYDPKNGRYFLSEKPFTVCVTYVLKSGFGLPEKYCILSIDPVTLPSACQPNQSSPPQPEVGHKRGQGSPEKSTR